MVSSGIKILLDALEWFYSNIIDRRFSLSNDQLYQQEGLSKIGGIDLEFAFSRPLFMHSREFESSVHRAEYSH